MKPWEKYAANGQQQPAEAEGPWTKYASANQDPAAPTAPKSSRIAKTNGKENYWGNFGEGMKTEVVSMPLGLMKGMSDVAQDKPAESYEKSPMGLVEFVLDRSAKLSPASIGPYLAGKNLNNAGLAKPLTTAARQNAKDAARLAQLPGGLVGQVAGGIVTAPLMPQAGTIKQAAALGAAMGLLRPVDAEDGEQTAQRLTNAAGGGVGGAIGGALANGISRGVGAVVRKGKEVLNSGRETAGQMSDQVVNEVRALMRQNGIDFDRLSQAAKADALRVVRDALGTGSKDNANAAAREAALATLKEPIKGTKGQLTQDYAQHRNETLLADSGSQALRDRMDEQAAKVAKNIDLTRQAAKGQVMSEADAGRKVRGVFDRLYEAEKAKTKALYQAAEEKEGKLPVKVGDDLLNFFKENAGFDGVGALLSKAKALGVVGVDVEGKLVAKPVEARKLYGLRSAASTLQKDGGSAAKYAADAKAIVDDAFDNLGPMYKQAAAQRRQQAIKFELPQILQKVYGEAKGGLDPKVADEDLVRALAKGSIQDIKNLKRTLLLNPKAVNPREAVGLWQDMRQQMLDDITAKSVIQDGAKTKINYQTLKNNLDKIGDDRLKLILGPKVANELRQIEAAARILFKAPEQKTGGSGTAGNLMLRLKGLSEMAVDGMASRVPFVGRAVAGGMQAARAAHKANADTAEALAPIGAQIKKDLRKRQLEQLLSSLPASTARRVLGQLGALSGVGLVAPSPLDPADSTPE
jgi:hypothetical protein